jgi:hypothetical protein
MLGHESQEIRSTYIAPYLARIGKKLQDYWVTNSGLLHASTQKACDNILGELYNLDREYLERDASEKPIPEAVSNVISFLRRQGSK